MKQLYRMPTVLGALLLLLVSCAAQFPWLATATLSEATDLQHVCRKQNYATPELIRADSLYAHGAELVSKKKNQEAFLSLDHAATLYRIAIASNTLAQQEKEIAEQKVALTKNMKDAAAYKQVLKELETMEHQ